MLLYIDYYEGICMWAMNSNVPSTIPRPAWRNTAAQKLLCSTAALCWTCGLFQAQGHDTVDNN